MLCKWLTTHLRVIVPLSCRHRAREPEDGLRRRERPSVGNVFRRGAVSNRRVFEEPRPPADLHGGETRTFPRQHYSGGFHLHTLPSNPSNVLLCCAPPFLFSPTSWEIRSEPSLSGSWGWEVGVGRCHLLMGFQHHDTDSGPAHKGLKQRLIRKCSVVICTLTAVIFQMTISEILAGRGVTFLVFKRFI